MLLLARPTLFPYTTLFRSQNNAKKKAAESNARQALSAIKVYYTDKQDYARPVENKSALKLSETSVCCLPPADLTSTGPNEVSWNAASATVMSIAVKSKAGD